MRSDLVFVANGHVDNRFLLCHLVRVASRRFHRAGAPIQETINKVLGLVREHAGGSGTVDNKAEWEALFRQPPLRMDFVPLRRPAKKASKVAVVVASEPLHDAV